MYVCGILSAELALRLRVSFDRARAWLLLWAITTTVLFAMHYVFFTRQTWLLPYTDTIYTACNLMVYPLYLIYIKELTELKPLKHRLHLFYMVLGFALCAAAMVGILYVGMSKEELSQFIDYELYGNSPEISGITVTAPDNVAIQTILHLLCRVAFAIEVVLTLVVGTRKILKYNRMVDELFADTEDKHMHQIITILALTLVTAVLSMTVNFLGREHFLSLRWIELPALCFSVLLFFIGHVGLHQQFSVKDFALDSCTADIQPEQKTTESATESATDEHVSKHHTQVDNGLDEIASHLRKTVEEEQIFLKPDLKLDELARRLGTNRTYLLRALRENLGMTFTEYINRQRIAYAKKLMQQNPTLGRAEIAERSGYVSVSSFYRNLKEYGG